MKKPLFIILVFALLGSGCNTVGLVYRNADLYLAHKIGAYASFNAGQKETIRREVDDYMSWHRKIALPEYIIFLQNLNGTAQHAGPLRVDEVARLRAHLLGLYKKTMEPAIMPTAQLLNTLDSRQIMELSKAMAKEIREQRHEALGDSPEEHLAIRAEMTIDFLEWLLGDLSDKQVEQITTMSRRLPPVRDIYIQVREANQRKLIALLNSHAGTEKIAAFLSSWLLRPEMYRTPQQQHDILSFEKATDEMIMQIHGLLTARQKAHLDEKITAYILEMQKLITEPNAASYPSRQDNRPTLRKGKS